MLRDGLPPLPERMRRLPLDARGYPVPWFVAWLDGVPDFRVVGPGKIVTAINKRVCWLCGERLGSYGAFVIGPMCAVNRTSSEPPSHRDCAIFAARACPFLTRPKAQRREANLPADKVPPAGAMIERNPGVCLVWVTRRWQWYAATNGVLCEVGDPTETLWYAEGRTATRAEIEESICTGLPIIRAEAEREGPASVAELDQMVARAMLLLPARTHG